MMFFPSAAATAARIPLAAFALFALGLSAPRVWAQDAPEPPPAPVPDVGAPGQAPPPPSPLPPRRVRAQAVPGAPPAAQPAAKEPTVTIDFAGGTLLQYVEHLSKESSELNAVVGKEAQDLEMPPVSLKRVSVSTAINLIPAMVKSGDERSLNVQTIEGDSSEGSQVHVINLTDLPGGPPRFLSRPGQPGLVGGMPGALSGSRSARMVQVFSLKGLTEVYEGRPQLSMKPESVLTAIDTVLGLADSGEKAEVKFHSDTGLLFVQGTPAQVDGVKQVLTTLSQDQQQKLSEEFEALKSENRRLYTEIERLKNENKQLPLRQPKSP